MTGEVHKKGTSVEHSVELPEARPRRQSIGIRSEYSLSLAERSISISSSRINTFMIRGIHREGNPVEKCGSPCCV